MNVLTPRRILIIGAGFLQSFAIRRARDMGLVVVAVDRDPEAPGFAWADVKEVVDIRDEQGCLDVAKRKGVQGVVSVCTDFAVKTVAFVAGSLGLPGLSLEAARTCTNKALVRRFLGDARVGAVAFGRARSYEEAARVASDIGFPCILKPVDSVGSKGVNKVEDNAQVAGAFEAASQASASGEVIVEDFIEGPEISVEAVTVEGKTRIAAVTDKITSGPPHFVELGHTQPSVFSDEEAVREIVDGCVRALGIDDSGTHIELKFAADGAKVMEVGARLGGDRITSDLVPLSTGTDLMEAAILIALGVTPNVERKWRRGAAIRYAVVPAGRVVAVGGVDSARSVKGVTDVQVDASVGDVIPELESSADRVVHVVAGGATASEAAAAAEEALSKIRIEVTK